MSKLKAMALGKMTNKQIATNSVILICLLACLAYPSHIVLQDYKSYNTLKKERESLLKISEQEEKDEFENRMKELSSLEEKQTAFIQKIQEAHKLGILKAQMNQIRRKYLLPSID